MVDGILASSRIHCLHPSDTATVLQINTNRHNSLRCHDIKSIIAAIENAEQTARVKMLIVTGVGSSFCTGLDVEHLKICDKQEVIDCLYYLDLLMYKIVTSYILIVSAVNGHTIGGGAIIAVASDYCIASDDMRTKIGFPEYKMGLFLPKFMGSLVFRRTTVGMKMLLFGKYVGVQEAMQMGIIDHCVHDDIIEEVLTLFSDVDSQTVRNYKCHNMNADEVLLPVKSNSEYSELASRIQHLKDD